MIDEIWNYPLTGDDNWTFNWFHTEEECVKSLIEYRKKDFYDMNGYYNHRIVDRSTGKVLCDETYFLPTRKIVQKRV